MEIDPELHAPPVLQVSWASLQLRCVLARVSQKFVMFCRGRHAGARAARRARSTSSSIPSARRRQINRQTADFSKVHVVIQGETLSGIAAQVYEDPELWRPIAIGNGIDDPRAHHGGQSLRIPSLPFTDPVTGEVRR